MGFESMDKPAVGDATKKEDMDQLIDNDNALNASISGTSGIGVANGSFENDDLTDPIGWDKVTAGVATGTLETTDRRHGKQAIKGAVVSGADAVSWESDTKIPVAVGQRIAVTWEMNASVTDVQVDVDVFWWYWTGLIHSAASTPSSSVYSSAANPTSWARRHGQVVAPAGANDAEFYTVKISLTLGVAGNVRIDGLTSREFHGIVDQTASSLTPSGTTYTVSKSPEQPIAAIISIHGTITSGHDLQLIGDGKTIIDTANAPNNTWYASQFRVPLNDDSEFTFNRTYLTVDLVGYEV